MDPISLPVFVAFSLLVQHISASPIMDLEEPFEDDFPLFDEVMSEQDGFDFNSLLETMKDDFLKTLNLSGIPVQAPVKVEPPEYMMELYNRFAKDRSSMPSANIVRSFKNEDFSMSYSDVIGVRKYPLLFNMSIPHHEEMVMAELKLYMLVPNARMKYDGVNRKVTIYEIHIEQDGTRKASELASRLVYKTKSEWEMFDITEVVRRWSRSELTTHKLEIHLQNSDVDIEATGDGNLDIDIRPETKQEPLLIVFSDDQSSDRKEEKEELNDMISHEQELGQDNDNLGNLGNMPSEESLLQMRSNIIYDASSRIRRNAKGNYCKKTSLYIDFKEIGWDSWIIAPSGYEAYECRGVCSYPLTEHVTPTKHAIVQTLVHMKNAQRASKACCVATKLDPISILYLDAGVVTYKYKYEGMVVSECGCR
ncbi:LOW QUALITY PROTEIN: bone morphogenetic protein 10 [Bombina bombina]|uniref:LOW QUALITY PROTEIN: bone morphogenetic protein 10 n=1 Tax=Bombina bombina TaxID=8345 RepID=UPI00235ACBB7|nr:LOW QUALITY PROTEIN: bone morphogenetic protein 10 [Bombina bombina]